MAVAGRVHDDGPMSVDTVFHLIQPGLPRAAHRRSMPWARAAWPATCAISSSGRCPPSEAARVVAQSFLAEQVAQRVRPTSYTDDPKLPQARPRCHARPRIAAPHGDRARADEQVLLCHHCVMVDNNRARIEPVLSQQISVFAGQIVFSAGAGTGNRTLDLLITSGCFVIHCEELIHVADQRIFSSGLTFYVPSLRSVAEPSQRSPFAGADVAGVCDSLTERVE